MPIKRPLEGEIIALVKRVKGIYSSLRELFSQNTLELFQKELSFFQNLFYFQKMLLDQPMQYQGEEFFFILQCFFNIFHKSRILVELAETKQNMKKVLLIF